MAARGATTAGAGIALRATRRINQKAHLGPAKILSERSVKMMGENNIGSIFVEVQAAADQSLTKPFPLGAGHEARKRVEQNASFDQDDKTEK